MPRMNKDGTRDYSYDTKYESSKKQKANRAERGRARTIVSKSGPIPKGDDVDHIKPVSKGGGNKRSNLRAIPASVNRAKGNRGK